MMTIAVKVELATILSLIGTHRAVIMLAAVEDWIGILTLRHHNCS